jgi:hypothetical protein
MKRSIALVVFVLVFLGTVGRTVYLHQNLYTSFDFWKRFPYLNELYGKSQYMQKAPTAIIPDEIINAYAGGSYVKGVSPILIAPDTPPLGRYIIGVSALLTGNENIIILIFALLSLLFLFQIGKKVFRSPVTAYILVACLCFEPLFFNQLIYTPLLDIMQLGLLLGMMLLFDCGREEKKTKQIIIYFLSASLVLGCFIATKFYMSGVPIVVAWVATLFVEKKWNHLRVLLLTFPLSFLILCLSYIRVLWDGYGFMKLVSIQKWNFIYHQGQLVNFGSVWQLLLLNRWQTWFGGVRIQSDAQWQFTWPIATITMIYSFIRILIHPYKKDTVIRPYIYFSIAYILFLSLGTTSTRYFVILVPVLFIVTFYEIERIIMSRTSKKSES